MEAFFWPEGEVAAAAADEGTAAATAADLLAFLTPPEAVCRTFDVDALGGLAPDFDWTCDFRLRILSISAVGLSSSFGVAAGTEQVLVSEVDVDESKTRLRLLLPIFPSIPGTFF